MTATQQTIESLRSLQGDYKYGFVTDIESDFAPEGPERGHRPLHLGQEGRAGVAARLAPEGVPHLAAAHEQEPTWAHVDAIPPIDFQDDHLLRRAEAKQAGPRASTKSIPSCSRPTRSSASRCTSEQRLAGRRGRRGVRQRLGRHHVQGEAGELGVIFCSFSEAVREHPELVRQVPRHASCRTATTSSRR